MVSNTGKGVHSNSSLIISTDDVESPAILLDVVS